MLFNRLLCHGGYRNGESFKSDSVKGSSAPPHVANLWEIKCLLEGKLVVWL